MTGLDVYDDPDTITRAEWRRARGIAEPRVCMWCEKPLTAVQVKRGGKFCSQRCAGHFNSQEPYRPKAVEEEEAGPVGIVRELIGDEYDVVTGDKNGPAPAPAARMPLTWTSVLGPMIESWLAQADEFEFSARIGNLSIFLRREP